MNRADRVSGFFWLVFSVVIAVECYRMGLGTVHEPGPGFLFFWTSIGMGVLSTAVLWRARSAGKGEHRVFGKKNLVKVLPVLSALFIYAVFMEWLGFIPITLALFLFLLGVIEKKGWGFTLITSGLVTGVAYLIFQVWLKSQLPKGILESLRF